MSIEPEYKDRIIAVISALIPEAKIYLLGVSDFEESNEPDVK